MDNADYLIEFLLNENTKYQIAKAPTSDTEKFNMYRSLCNVRNAQPISEEFLEEEKKYLEEIRNNKDITCINDVKTLNEAYPDNNIYHGDKICLWRGDITCLKVEAIVNAANSQGLGCFIPGHNCIDNQIHTYAGVSLRLACDKYMKNINYNLPTGGAFITRAYNLPSDYVIHTVGPVIQDNVSEHDKKLLGNCYTNCLKIAENNNIRSIAFCSISTGVFRFPKDLACKVAIKSVNEYLDENEDKFDKIIFNVYSREALEIYERNTR